MHVTLGLVMGAFLARASRWRFASALAVPAALHALYDWPLLTLAYQRQGENAFTSPWMAILAAVLLCMWLLLRGPVANILASAIRGEPSRVAMPPGSARLLVRAAGALGFILWFGAWLAVGAVVIAAMFVHEVPAALAIVAILPGAFGDLWRRAHLKAASAPRPLGGVE
jgi:hypothetical protein